jgi:cyclopropane fatty-acyl-phospholipid synthase-like methyltransferase
MTRNKQAILDYYQYAEKDYQWIWHLDAQMAMHYGYWDEKTSGLEAALRRENEVLAKRAGIKKTDVILDAGCGVGGSSLFLAATFGCRVIGITLSEHQVETARHNARKMHLEKQVTFKAEDFTATSFPDNTFDVVWAIESVCHALDKNDFIKEAYRILKPGGRLILADGFAAKEEYSPNEARLMRLWLQGWGVESLATIQQFVDGLRLHGFADCHAEDVTARVMPSSVRLYRYSFPGYVVDFFLRLVRLRNTTAHRNVVAARYQYISLRKRLWAYHIVLAVK